MGLPTGAASGSADVVKGRRANPEGGRHARIGKASGDRPSRRPNPFGFNDFTLLVLLVAGAVVVVARDAFGTLYVAVACLPIAVALLLVLARKSDRLDKRTVAAGFIGVVLAAVTYGLVTAVGMFLD